MGEFESDCGQKRGALSIRPPISTISALIHLPARMFAEMFPVFGMVMAILGAARNRAYQDRVLREAREKLER